MSRKWTPIRNFHGSWPDWFALLEDGRTLALYIRYGSVAIGVGGTEQEAFEARQEVATDSDLGGVTTDLEALNELKKQGYDYVCPTDAEAIR